MTFRFTGTLKFRFRLSLFGHDVFAGPWQTKALDFSQSVPEQAESLSLPDGFSGKIGAASDGVSLSLTWEGLPLVLETIPVAGSIPIQVQPLKGVILSGTASVGS